MLKRILFALSFLLSVAPLAAGDWHPFVGVAGLWETPTWKQRWTPSESWQAQFMNLGGQADAGVLWGRHEFYLGYHASESPVKEENYSVNVQATVDSNIYFEKSQADKWRERRVFLGYRHHFGGVESPRVHAILGAALSLGQSHWSYDEIYRTTRYGFVRDSGSGHYFNVQTMFRTLLARNSDLLPGLVLEFGASVPLLSRLEALMLTQCHVYREVFPEAQTMIGEGIVIGYGRERYWMLMPSIALQLRYTFGQ